MEPIEIIVADLRSRASCEGAIISQLLEKINSKSGAARQDAGLGPGGSPPLGHPAVIPEKP